MASTTASNVVSSILVIGGGPGGSYTATVLAREGLDVVLLEASKFPRYHVGEGMLPSMRHFLRYIDLEDEFHNHGFMHKPGACFVLNQGLQMTYTDFSALGPSMTTWNVIRSESDEMMLCHASRQGVKVFEETRVESIEFRDGESSGRPIAATWKNKEGQSGRIHFEWLVDASGRAGIMSTRYLHNRQYREGLRNIAVWGYWKGVKINQAGTRRSNAPWFEAMSDELGWAWLIPLHDGTTSIGVVMHQNISNKKKADYPGGRPTLTEHYLDQMKFLPGVLDLIGNEGSLVEGSIKSSTDYSYHSSSYSGDHFRILGDAASFVDPFFASGVHIAMTGALSAATSICASMKSQVTETQAQQWHNTKVGICHTRFLIIVLSAYKQMQNQRHAILSDVNDNNFDKVFSFFKPVIQGFADTTPELTDSKLDSLIDFCINLFERTKEEEHISVAKRVQPDLLSLQGPAMGDKELDEAVGPEDVEAKRVLSRINALKILQNDVSPVGFGKEAVDGYVVRLKRGELGLVKESVM
ncbi:FAD/NAD P-binding domain-containing protein [Gloeophyllum trabeum ATCC 11539]|uniref:FAD/NAD P-binding domain-containing protein n=1 Tax=Gloeophyllum trabeum (strain ATCC 11539 / FP-39264 / Madison 617) TaxID=670483 RepID=S7RAK6_GLOTA|nr:FAD/NAD P-binding domain-containing protein [Gloeophyllum trabeum ATCC 11539]EPQ51290.1 FAD/NAD P-binding domain-containing protein [Gloeophyllum trabeum ATCC 11539]